MSIQVDVQSWGGDCGQRPQSTSSPGGRTFSVSQDGDQLTFHLSQQRSTRSCWSENRAVRRVSSTYQSGTWRIVCRTPPEDARSETGTYTIQAVGLDQLSFRDVSRYDWQLNDSRCQATITTLQSFTRASPRPPTPTATPPEEPRPVCTPGAAARVQLRPSSAELSPGGERCFTVRLVDARGCALRSPRIDVRLAEGSAGELDGRCYRAPEGDARARIVAQSGELRDEATVVVRTMDLTDLIARRSESGSLGGGESEHEASGEVAARVSTRTAERGGGILLPGAALGLALLLIAAGTLFLARRRRAPTSGIGGLREVEPPPEGPGAPPAPTAAEQDMICPSCRRGYPPDSTRCSLDGTALVPYAEFASATTARERTCPRCGERYPGHVTFCGKDGSPLE